jgi:hypothetical protein
MVRRIVGSIWAVMLITLLAVSSGAAQEAVSGTVQQVDERTGVIVLDDGRRVQTGGRTVVLVERPVDRLAALAPGTRVVIVERPEPSASPGVRAPSPAFGQFGPTGPQAL